MVMMMMMINIPCKTFNCTINRLCNTHRQNPRLFPYTFSREKIRAKNRLTSHSQNFKRWFCGRGGRGRRLGICWVSPMRRSLEGLEGGLDFPNADLINHTLTLERVALLWNRSADNTWKGRGCFPLDIGVSIFINGRLNCFFRNSDKNTFIR